MIFAYTQISRLKAANAELRQIAVDPKNEFLALGYADGTVAAFQLATEELLFASKSHKTAVSALTFTDEGSTLASGSLVSKHSLVFSKLRPGTWE